MTRGQRVHSSRTVLMPMVMTSGRALRRGERNAATLQAERGTGGLHLPGEAPATCACHVHVVRLLVRCDFSAAA